MSLNKAITQAIKDNMPGAVAQELATYLDQAEMDKAKIDQLEGAVEYWKQYHEKEVKKNEVHQNERAKLNRQLKAHDDLAERERKVLERENKLEVTLAKADMENAVRRADAIFELVGKVFRNPSYTSHEQHNGENLATGRNIRGAVTRTTTQD